MAIKTTNLKDDDKKVSIMNIVTLIRTSIFFAALLFILFSIKPALAVELSKEEQAYLSSKETITFVSQTRYPPFEFVGPDGDHTGMCIELVRWIATQFGFKAHFTDMSFKEAQQVVLSGKVDVLTSLFFSEKRDKIFDFTKVMFKVPASIFVLAERPDIKEINDLKDKTIAMQAGDYALEFLEKKNIVFNVVYTRNFAEAINLVIAGKADATIGDEQIVLYHIFSNHLTEKIKKIGEPLYIGQNCMGVKGSNPTLISILNKGIDLAVKQGVLNRIQKKWVGTHYAAIEPSWFKYVPYLLVIIGVIILLSASVWFWNVQLRQQVTLRTEELKNSEEQFRFITEKMADIVWTLDRDFKTTYVSPSIKSVLGFTPEERKRQTIEEMITPESLQRVHMMFLEELAKDDEGTADSDRFVTNEVEHYHRDGSTVWLENRVKAIRNSSRSIIGFHGVSRDITNRKRAEEALKESEEHYRAIVEDQTEIICRHLPDGTITFVNDAYCRYFAKSKEEFIGHSFKPLIPDEDKEKVAQHFVSFNHDNIVATHEHRVIDPNGKIRWHQWTNRALFDKSGNIVEFQGTGRDITEWKKAEEEKNKLQAQLQRAQKMEAIGTLAGGVAHDLNNVLSGIVSYPDLLLMDIPEDSPLRKPILTIQESGQKAATIVQDLLTLARRGVVATDVTNINQVIDSYLNSPEHEKLKEIYPDAKIESDLEINLLNIIGSPVHLSKTVMNLVNNAAEAMPDGGSIFISTKSKYIDKPIRGYDDVKEGDYVTLTVSDTGTGISSGDLERMFEPFYTKKVMGRSGTGLGMAVVWGTVKDHKGYIDVQSTEGKGTTFTLYFPVTRKEVTGKEKALSMEEYMGKGESILVVDDVKEQREIASRILIKLGYSATSVSSGEEAVDYIKDNSVDLLVLDMIMDPGIDGLETYKRILELHPGQKAIIASGFSETERVKEAQRLGAGKYIKKPYTMEKIGIAVKEELGK